MQWTCALEWLGFAIFMPLVFGVSSRRRRDAVPGAIGLVSVETYREKRKFAIFFLAIFAAVITPSTDIFSMEMHIPMSALTGDHPVPCGRGKSSMGDGGIEDLIEGVNARLSGITRTITLRLGARKEQE